MRFIMRAIPFSIRIILGVAIAVGVGIALPRVLTPTVHIAMNNSGLASLKYRDVDYIADGRFQLNSIEMKTSSGDVVKGSLAGRTRTDPAAHLLTQDYPWGTIQVTYTAVANKLDLKIAVENRSPNTITGLFADPLVLRFPTKPREYDNVTPILAANSGDVTTLRVNYGPSSSLLLCNDDVSKPLLIGFPFAHDRPTSTVFPLRMITSQDKTLPDSLPYIDRPIAAGATDTFHISLRFGSSSDKTKALAADVYTSFAQTHPFALDWPDRRPIGSLILATTAAGWRTNPRGWLLDKTIDVSTNHGRGDFQEKMLGWADRSIRVLLDMHAQGMITWDIEGEEFPQSTTYIGDPRALDQLAPEMNEIADAYFKKFREAGLRVGICIRPQQLVVSNNGHSAKQVEPADPAKVLIDKVTYARNRWGATLFYIDSNGDPNRPYPVEVLERVQKAVPNVLLIPEHHNLSYYAATAPYVELRQDRFSTPAQVRDVIPEAFSVINIADGAVAAKHQQLQDAVKRGDILLFRGWYDDPLNAKIRDLVPPGSE